MKTCLNCHKNYESKDHRSKFCSLSCSNFYRENNKAVKFKFCNVCKLSFKIQGANYLSKKIYCSRSCAAKYNNRHKTVGIRRSKLEAWIESQLTLKYPNLSVEYNKTTNGFELDIYIPNLRLAFELNGIFHYEPIYGIEKLERTKKNDVNKFQECQRLGISLCVLDTSKQKKFSKNSSIIYLEVIEKIISSLEGYHSTN
jgi:hypothetical protein